MIFTESAHWADSVYKSQCPWHVSLSICPCLKTLPPGLLETSGRRAYRSFWHTSRLFLVLSVLMIFCVLKFFLVFGSLWTSLCIGGDLPLWGSVAVAVGVSDRWQATCDKWHMTRDICTGHLTTDFFFFFLFPFCPFW